MPVKVKLTEKQIADGKAALKQLRIDGRETATGFGKYVDMLTPILAPQHPAATIQNLRSVVFNRNEDGWCVMPRLTWCRTHDLPYKRTAPDGQNSGDDRAKSAHISASILKMVGAAVSTALRTSRYSNEELSPWDGISWSIFSINGSCKTGQ